MRISSGTQLTGEAIEALAKTKEGQKHNEKPPCFGFIQKRNRLRRFDSVLGQFKALTGFNEHQLLDGDFYCSRISSAKAAQNLEIAKQEAIEKNGRYLSCYDFQAKDGSLLNLLEIGHYFEEVGAESYFFGVVQNADEMDQREDATFVFYKKLIDSLPHQMFIKDLKSRYVYCNRNVKEFLGVQGSISGKTDWDLFDKALAVNHIMTDKEVVEKGKPLKFINHYQKNGKRVSFEVTKSPVYDMEEKIIGILGMVKEMTAQNRQKYEAAEQEKSYRLMMQNTADIIWILGFEGQESYISPSLVHFNGYTPEEFMKLPVEQQVRGSSVSVLLKLLNYYQEMAKEYQVIEDPTKHFQRIEVEINCRDGSSKWAELSTGFFLDDDGKVLGIQGITRDINDRKSYEMDTSKMLNEEKKVNELKSQIISTISHEFRTPISIINSNLQLLNNYKFKLDDEIQQDAFELSFLAINNLTNILDDITVLHKSNKGILNYKPALLDIKKLVEGVVNELQSIPENKGRIELTIDTGRSLIKMDRTLLEHILTNLITNALKFSPEQKKVYLQIGETDHQRLTFVVKDQGLGIPENELENIWESFFRGSNTKGTKGTGLGMTIVKRCVDKHKGEIYIESEVNKGTEVTVILPYEQ